MNLLYMCIYIFRNFINLQSVSLKIFCRMNSREKDIRFSGSTGFSISNFFPYRMNASDSSIPQLSIHLQNRRMLFFPLLRYRFVLVASSKTSRSPIERTIPIIVAINPLSSSKHIDVTFNDHRVSIISFRWNEENEYFYRHSYPNQITVKTCLIEFSLPNHSFKY